MTLLKDYEKILDELVKIIDQFSSLKSNYDKINQQISMICESQEELKEEDNQLDSLLEERICVKEEIELLYEENFLGDQDIFHSDKLKEIQVVFENSYSEIDSVLIELKRDPTKYDSSCGDNDDFSISCFDDIDERCSILMQDYEQIEERNSDQMLSNPISDQTNECYENLSNPHNEPKNDEFNPFSTIFQMNDKIERLFVASQNEIKYWNGDDTFLDYENDEGEEEKKVSSSNQSEIPNSRIIKMLDVISSFIDEKGICAKYVGSSLKSVSGFYNELQTIETLHTTNEKLHELKDSLKDIQKKFRYLVVDLECAIENQDAESDIAEIEKQKSEMLCIKRDIEGEMNQLKASTCHIITNHCPELIKEEIWSSLLIPSHVEFRNLPHGIFIESRKLSDYSNVKQTSKQGMFKAVLDENQQVLLKSYPLTTETGRMDLSNQLSLVTHMEHPNLVKVQAVFVGPQFVYVQMPIYHHGDVSQWIETINPTLEERKLLFGDILRAVLHLHSRGIVHSSIQLSNILVDENGKGVLGDFDRVKKVCEESSSSDPSLISSISINSTSLRYLSPEIRSKLDENTMRICHDVFTLQSDIFALGVCCQEMFSPFEEEFSDDYSDLISTLLNFNPELRGDVQSILRHPFVFGFINLRSENENQSISSISSSSIPPIYWFRSRCSGFSSRFIDLSSDERIMHQFQLLLSLTCKTDKIGIGKDGNGMTHKFLRILKVTRVENEVLWRSYSSKRALIPPPSHLLSDVKTADIEITKQLGLDVTKNEHLLFHGSPPQLVDIITSQGFDERVSRTSGFFGAGIYFSECSSKADAYCGRNVSINQDERKMNDEEKVNDDKKTKSGSIGEKAKMIVSRVILGDAHFTNKPLKGIRRPPCVLGHINCNHNHNQSSSQNHKLCNSVISTHVVNKLLKNYREFVIYDRELSYPEFVVEYERTNLDPLEIDQDLLSHNLFEEEEEQ